MGREQAVEFFWVSGRLREVRRDQIWRELENREDSRYELSPRGNPRNHEAGPLCV